MSESQLPLPSIDYSKLRLSLQRLEEQYANFRSTEVPRPQLDQEAVSESVIQHFKICYDCLWKVLRRYLIDGLGIPDVPNSPKPIFRLAHQNNLFRLPIDQWLVYADRRIDTACDYDGEKAKACFEVVPDFIGDAKDLCQTMSGGTWQ